MSNETERESANDTPMCMRRRDVLISGAVGTTAGLMAPGLSAQAAVGEKRQYPRLPVINISELKEGEPVAFNYPLENQPNMIVKLGKPAQGGVGPESDIVAFSVLCTHMGGSLRGRYRHDSKAMGPCPFHFSTFDLTKGGTPVHASATENLPQVRLTTEGDQVVAVGMEGLVYGYRDNLADGEFVVQRG